MNASLPTELFELLNVATAAVCAVVCCYCVLSFISEYRRMTIGGMPPLKALTVMRTWHIHIGTTIAFFGIGIGFGWRWFARFAEGLGYDASWMGRMPWVLVPVFGTLIVIIGAGCISRSLVPLVWRPWAYIINFVVVLVVIVLVLSIPHR